MLGGLDSPSSGEVLFRGSPLGTVVNLDSFRFRQVGFIFQAFHLLPTLRAVENVQVAMLAVNGRPIIASSVHPPSLRRWA